MKTLLLFATLALSINVFGQSKKDQIITLNNSIDSLNTVLKTTRNNATKDIGGLNITIEGLNSEITQLIDDVSGFELSMTKLTKDNEKFKTEIEEMTQYNMALRQAQEGEDFDIDSQQFGDLIIYPYDLFRSARLPWEAAKLSCEMEGEGWRLPTNVELNFMYENRNIIGRFRDTKYWSSEEQDSSWAWHLNFYDGIGEYRTKSGYCAFRPVRDIVKKELPKQPNCGDIDGIEIEKLGDKEKNIPSDYTGAAFYCDNGVLRNLYKYKDGDITEKRKFHENGKLKMENIYNYGTQISQRNWDENGLLTSETIWKDDERIEKCFDKDGNEIDCGERY